MSLMRDRAKIAERENYDRSKAVFEYFGLPFDAQPPAQTATMDEEFALDKSV